MKKSEIYSWRVSTDTKAALERVARGQGRSVAQLLEQAVQSWLEATPADSGDAEAQRRLQQSAAKWLGKLRGGDPSRSERARENLRARLKKQRAA
jgi:predicted transcriptional regulator